MIAALVLSASRGGVISILLAVIAASALAALLRDRGAKGTSRIFRIAGSALVVALVAFGAEVLEKRIEAGFFEAEGRMLMREASYRMIADYPIFGSGAGSWEFLYPAYRDPETYIPLRTLHAHNDHLELLAEQGVIGYLFIASAIVLSLREMIPRKSGGRDPLIEGILFGSVIAVLSLLIHAWADFNFQIPANAAWFFAVLALGLVAARRLDEGRYPSARPGSKREPVPVRQGTVAEPRIWV
jgi:O-antigen ligase